MKRIRLRAFTLVELLAVMAIVSILMAMLLPMLGRARETARGVACMGTMKQLYFAIDAGADAQKEAFRGRWLNYYDDGRKDASSPRFYRSDAGFWTQYLRAYFFNRPTSVSPNTPAMNDRNGGAHFTCPSDRKYRTATPTTSWYWVTGDNFGRYASYGLNVTAFGTQYDLPPKRSQLQWPSRTVMLAEVSGIMSGNRYVEDTINGTDDSYRLRHLGRNNFLYTDGHVKLQSMVDPDIYFIFNKWWTFTAEQYIPWYGRPSMTTGW